MMSEKVEKIIPLMHHILYFLSRTLKKKTLFMFQHTLQGCIFSKTKNMGIEFS